MSGGSREGRSEGSSKGSSLGRAERVHAALQQLQARPVSGLAQGLDPGLAAWCLRGALEPLTVASLVAALRGVDPDRVPESVGIVVARGVFTAPIEWAALYATAGCRVVLKAPHDAPELCDALAAALSAQGLPVRASTSHDLAGLEAVVVFGSDETGAALRSAWPAARLTVFGHRVSAAVVDTPDAPEARRDLARCLAQDVLRYDTRGCMAPTGVFARGDVAALAVDLHQQLAASPWPRAPLDPALGAEWRRRVALARALGRAWLGPQHAVLILPAAHYLPLALPRMVCLHPLADSKLPESEAGLSVLSRAFSTVPLSSLALSLSPGPVGTALRAQAYRLAPRCCVVGSLQTPAFPRLHDGVDMLACVLRPGPGT